MDHFDDNSIPPADPASAPHGDPFLPASVNISQTQVPGDPFAMATSAVAPDADAHFRKPSFPEDLRISWSWPHLLAFLFFGFASLLVIQGGLAIAVTSGRHMTPKQVQDMLEANAQFIVGSNVLWFAFLLLFLYVTLAVLRDS